MSLRIAKVFQGSRGVAEGLVADDGPLHLAPGLVEPAKLPEGIRRVAASPSFTERVADRGIGVDRGGLAVESDRILEPAHGGVEVAELAQRGRLPRPVSQVRP